VLSAARRPAAARLVGGSGAALVFEGGLLNLVSAAGVPLTRHLGLYSSLYSARRATWTDSTQSFWTILESTPGRLVLSGRWPWSGVVQTWRFSFRGDALLWSAEVLPGREPVDTAQFCLMLAPELKGWRCDLLSGSFSGAAPVHSAGGEVWHSCFSGRGSRLCARPVSGPPPENFPE
jgi:hypothetical protein